MSSRQALKEMLILFGLVGCVIALTGTMLFIVVSRLEAEAISNSTEAAYATVSRQGEARVFFRIKPQNRSSPMQFTQVESPDANNAAIYYTKPNGKTVPVQTQVKSPGGLKQILPVSLDPDQPGAFKPDGYFIKLTGLKKDVYTGDLITVTLSGPKETKIQVKARAIGEQKRK